MASLHCRRQALTWHESGKVMGRKAGCAGCLIHQQSQEGSVSIHDFCFDLAQLEILEVCRATINSCAFCLGCLDIEKTTDVGPVNWRPFPWRCRNFSVYHVDRQTRRKTHQWQATDPDFPAQHVPKPGRCKAGYGSIPMKIPFLVGWTSINPSYFDVNYRATLGFDTLPAAFFYSKIFERRVPRFERGMTSWIKSTACSAPPESRISSAKACAFQRKALLLVPRSSSLGNGNQWKSMGSITSNQHECNNSRVYMPIWKLDVSEM